MSISAGGIHGHYRSVGMDSSAMLERLGVPGSVSAALGAEIDEALGDIPGMFQNLTDMFTRGVGEDLGKLFGSVMAPGNFAPRPLDILPEAFTRSFGGFSPLGGVAREAPFGTGNVGRSIEAAAKRDPLFKSALERALGGIIVPDGRNDGKLTVMRPGTPEVGGALQDSLAKGLLAATGIASSLAGLGLPFGPGGPLMGLVARLSANLADFANNGPQANGAPAEQQAGGASGAGGSGGWAGAVGPEGEEFAKGMGIDLANASFEDVLFLLLMKYAQKKEQEIMKKVKELDKGGGANAEGGAGGAGSGGGAGGAGSAGGAGGAGSGGGIGGAGCGGPAGCVSGCVSGCTGGSGGAITGALGQLAGGIAGAGGGGGVGGGGGPGGAGGPGGGEGGGGGGDGFGDPSKMSDTMKQQMIQKLMGDLQKLYEMLSNMIKAMHDMQMTPTRNLRG